MLHVYPVCVAWKKDFPLVSLWLWVLLFSSQWKDEIVLCCRSTPNVIRRFLHSLIILTYPNCLGKRTWEVEFYPNQAEYHKSFCKHFLLSLFCVLFPFLFAQNSFKLWVISLWTLSLWHYLSDFIYFYHRNKREKNKFLFLFFYSL